MRAADLQAGDLFSKAGQEYWDLCLADHHAIGQKVFIRTDEPTPEDQKDIMIYKITIIYEPRKGGNQRGA